MTKLELLQLFFDAWAEAQGIDARTMEGRAARDLIEARAQAVRDHVPSAADMPLGAAGMAQPIVDPAVHAFRQMQNVVNSIEPKSTHNHPVPNKAVTIVSG